MTDLTLWHATKADGRQTGIRRYEDTLSAGIRPDSPGVDVRRAAGRWRGSTVASWLLDYRRYGADIVHATSGPAGVPALARRPKRLVVTSHGPIPVRYPRLAADRTTRLQWRLMDRVLDAADAVIANSAFTKGELLDVYGLPGSKLHLAPLGVNLDRFHPAADGPAPETFGYDSDRPNVLVLSSNLPQKRMDVAVEVIDRLADRVQFVKAGYGETLAHPAVWNAGFVAEAHLPALYSGADVLFHPSEYESFGLPLAEALACGTPVVARDCTAIPEVVGNAGVLVDAEARADAFADAIETALAADWGNKTRRRAARFPWSRTVERTKRVYEAVAG